MTRNENIQDGWWTTESSAVAHKVSLIGKSALKLSLCGRMIGREADGVTEFEPTGVKRLCDMCLHLKARIDQEGATQ